MSKFQATEEELLLLPKSLQQILRLHMSGNTHARIGRKLDLKEFQVGIRVRQAKKLVKQIRQGGEVDREIYKKLPRVEQDALPLATLLKPRVVNRLRSVKIDTVGDLTRHIKENFGGDPQPLLNLPNLGRIGFNSILKLLEDLGRVYPYRVE